MVLRVCLRTQLLPKANVFQDALAQERADARVGDFQLRRGEEHGPEREGLLPQEVPVLNIIKRSHCQTYSQADQQEKQDLNSPHPSAQPSLAWHGPLWPSWPA